MVEPAAELAESPIAPNGAFGMPEPLGHSLSTELYTERIRGR